MVPELEDLGTGGCDVFAVGFGFPGTGGYMLITWSCDRGRLMMDTLNVGGGQCLRQERSERSANQSRQK